jgi:hypothetical protein
LVKDWIEQPDATLFNTPTFNSSSPKSFTFNPAGYQYAGSNAVGDLTTWTIEAWYKPNADTNGHVTSLITTVFEDDVGNRSGYVNYELGTNGNTSNESNITAGYFDGSQWHNTGGYAPSLGVWQYVVATFDGTGIRQYLNGVMVDYQRAPGVCHTGTPSGIRLARRWDSQNNVDSYFMPVDIGMVRIVGSYSIVGLGTGAGVNLTSGNYVDLPVQLTGTSWTVELVASFDNPGGWCTIWANEIWDNQQGWFAYLSDSSIHFGGAGNSHQATFAVSDTSKAHWAFVNDNGTPHIYRNGTEISGSGGFLNPPGGPAANVLRLGARHFNDNSAGGNDPGPGNYYYTKVTNSALSGSDVATAYSALQSTYGI